MDRKAGKCRVEIVGWDRFQEMNAFHDCERTEDTAPLEDSDDALRSLPQASLLSSAQPLEVERSHA